MKIFIFYRSDEQGVPYFKDHDMELDINVIIDNDDIKNVSKR